LPIDGRIDLHGLTQDEAHRALTAFIGRMRRSGARCVLVITGRGLRTGGVLRQAVPQWLDAPGLRDMVLAFGPARIEHGGEGALYVLLRRRTGSTTNN
jgi:DNA-nicking Smr family endonuclease